MALSVATLCLSSSTGAKRAPFWNVLYAPHQKFLDRQVIIMVFGTHGKHIALKTE
ncbi:hypothetical protein DPMN_067954 [Dreissena polymorpha]|uniref:Uncharacterized protein n=1 Tax=Dreissena polymorpha TaxID=45954 RepID=A0A9D3YY96_DREPO|nr:hypothetical protein DPMN_067954 [Dreissena polymorpha]